MQISAPKIIKPLKDTFHFNEVFRYLTLPAPETFEYDYSVQTFGRVLSFRSEISPHGQYRLLVENGRLLHSHSREFARQKTERCLMMKRCFSTRQLSSKEGSKCR